jgi:hypothetical protein
MRDRRAVARYVGLTGSPDESGAQQRREQGLARAGNHCALALCHHWRPLSVIATPTHAIRIKRPSAAPTGIDWTRLTAEDLEEMPILAELKRMTLGRDDEGL